ncbi:hypothetical protein [Paenibacillus massiliensis]|nr:hypothetical protein [Paenibacillus massiliensis]
MQQQSPAVANDVAYNESWLAIELGSSSMNYSLALSFSCQLV